LLPFRRRKNMQILVFCLHKISLQRTSK
jgi:hypothetical protein